MARDVLSRNHDGCEDPAYCSRYELGEGAHAPWRREVAKGRITVAKWLAGRGVSPANAAFLNEDISLG